MGLNPSMADSIDAQLEQLAEGSVKDVEALQEEYDEALAEVKERVPETMGDAQVQSLALGQVRSDVTAENSIPRNSEQTRIVTLGYRGFIQMGEDNEDVLITYGIVDPADDDKPRRPGVILNEESSGADLYDIKEKFLEFGRTVEADYDVEESNNVSNTYILHATDETEPEVLDTEMSVEETRQWINDNFFEEAAKLADVGSHISQGGREGYPDMFGADIKRLQGTVADWFISQDGDTGGYVLQDDSIIDPNDYPEKIVGDKRVPGITCWTDPELMEYGDNSVCDFYGSISVMNDGQVVMNVFGIAPIMANDIEFDDDEEPEPETSGQTEERTI